MSSDKNKTRHTPETVRKGFLLDYKGIFTLSDFKTDPLKPLSFKVAIGVWIAFSAWVFVCHISVYELIGDMVANLIVWVPCILGFSIGAYAFLVGFSQAELMKRISEPRKDSPFTLFQIISGSFACNILIQSLTLVLAFVAHYVTFLDSKNSFHFSKAIVSPLNVAAFLVIGISFALSLAVTVQLTVN